MNSANTVLHYRIPWPALSIRKLNLEKAKCQHAVGKKVRATECIRCCTTGCNSVVLVYTSKGTVSVETPYRYEHVQQTCQHAEAQAQKGVNGRQRSRCVEYH